MVRELVIHSYLLIFKMLFTLFKIFPLKNKTTFVVSFGDNSQYLYEEMKKLNIQKEVVVLQKKNSRVNFREFTGCKVLDFESLNVFHFILSVYHLATSKTILVDNYFGFLAVTNFKEDVEVIQLWHAAGAVKKFGLLDHSVEKRTEAAKKRFLNVYAKFHKVVVGSEEMAKIFTRAFNLSSHSILRTGVPRTDFFYDTVKHVEIKKRFYEQNPHFRNKKVILYAPTYRDDEIKNVKLELDVKKLYEQLKGEYVLLIKLHPAIMTNMAYLEKSYESFIYDYSHYPNINELLLITDILITDYSSIPMEYSILKKPILFYIYDYESYKQERGLFDIEFPGPLVHDTDEIIESIKHERFDYERLESFAKKWNMYSNGKSSENLLRYIYKDDFVEVKERKESVL